jgi:Fur family ferric uptake transcriptional regulator
MVDYETLRDDARRRGFRLTRQRDVILHALCELEGHPSAEQVHERVRVRQRGVDLSTVYRALERLRDLRIVSQTDLGNGRAGYEFVLDDRHHHLICQECGRLVEMDHACLKPLVEAIQLDFGFEPIFDHMAIFGRCRECREGEDESSGARD